MTPETTRPDPSPETTLPTPMDLLTPEEAALQLRVGRTTVYKLMKEGSLRSITILGRRFLVRSDIERFITARMRASRPPETRR